MDGVRSPSPEDVGFVVMHRAPAPPSLPEGVGLLMPESLRNTARRFRKRPSPERRAQRRALVDLCYFGTPRRAEVPIWVGQPWGEASLPPSPWVQFPGTPSGVPEGDPGDQVRVFVSPSGSVPSGWTTEVERQGPLWGGLTSLSGSKRPLQAVHRERLEPMDSQPEWMPCPNDPSSRRRR